MTWIHIIGGGVSGLSLALALAERGELPGEVIVSDPALRAPRSQTFCFWFQDADRPLLKPEREWSSWSFSKIDKDLSSKHRSHHHMGNEFRYGMVSGERFRERAIATLEAHPQITFDEREVVEGPKAQHIFDSRPPPREDYLIHQSFVGFEMSCQHAYSLDCVGLMEDMTEGFGGLLFKYVLPLSADRILVEYTVFTKDRIDLDDLEQYAAEALGDEGLGSAKTLRIERAHIPMGLKRSRDSFGIPIGTRAGMARDSTGYGFVEMMRWAQRASEELINQGVVSPYHPPKVRTWMDRRLLSLIEHKPEILPNLFMALARALSPDRFASFMMSCRLSDAGVMLIRSTRRPFIDSTIGNPQWI